MNALIVAATENEISPFLSQNKNADILITGVGMVNTTFELTRKLLSKKYEWIVNAGIAGSLDKNIPIGTVCSIQEDFFSEIGFETPTGEFSSFIDSSLMKKEEIFIQLQKNNSFHPHIESLPKATGITVNTTHGNKNSIEKLQQFLQTQPFLKSPILESMEGAAVFFVCKKLNVKVIQIRAISNYIEERNTKKWDIPVAINNLNNCLFKIFSGNE